MSRCCEMPHVGQNHSMFQSPCCLLRGGGEDTPSNEHLWMRGKGEGGRGNDKEGRGRE